MHVTTTAENAPRLPDGAVHRAGVDLPHGAPNDPVTDDFARRAPRELLDRDLPHWRGRDGIWVRPARTGA
jgi:hypothetical protein